MKRLKLSKKAIQRIAEELPDLKDDVVEFFKENPNPDDDKLHEWAEDRDLDPHEVEEVVYELATEHVQEEEEGDDEDQIPGGLADDKKSEDFPKDQMEMGKEVEKEHTDDPDKAEEISRDHLEEDKEYYTKLKEMEKKAQNDSISVTELEFEILSKIHNEGFNWNDNFFGRERSTIRRLERKGLVELTMEGFYPEYTLTEAGLSTLEGTIDKEGQQMDPNQLQAGQSVWDTAGKEWTVVQDDPAQPYKTLMPAETSLSGVPEGVTPQNVVNVRDEETMSTYSLSQDEQASGVQMAEMADSGTTMAAGKKGIDYKKKIKIDEPYDKETIERAEDWMRMDPGETNVENWKDMDNSKKTAQEDINWNDLKDIATDLYEAIESKDFMRVTECTEDLTEMIMMNVSLPEDVSPEELTMASRVAQMEEEIIPESDEEVPDDETFPYNLPEGKNGFVDCMNRIADLRDEGFANVDIILKIGEEFDRDVGQKALDEAKYQGIL